MCHKQLKVGGAGRGRSPAYVGAECGHVRRRAEDVDRLVGRLVVAWLEQYADSDRLRPAAPAADRNAKALRTEARRLRARREQFRQLGEDGDMAPADVAAMLRGLDAKLGELDAQLAAAISQPDPLEGWRVGVPAAAWAAAPIARKRALRQALLESVVIKRAGKGGRVFHPETVAVTWRPEAGEPRT